MIWLFFVLTALAVFAVAAGTVGREAFRLGHQPPATIFDVDEAVYYVADELPEDAQARITYEEVRELVLAELDHLRDQGVFAYPGEEPKVAEVPGETDVVVSDDDAVAVLLAEGLEVADEDVVLVVDALHRYLEEIGAIGPKAS
ncbi:MAG TPA: hypothetical protein VIL36_01860 [Acidimicrobiales bacterium]